MWSLNRILLRSRILETISKRCLLTSPVNDVTIPELSFPEFILENVPKFSSQTAILDDVTNANYTYNDTLQITRNVSSGLRKHFNLKKGDVISILLPNSPEFIFSFLGITSTGAAVSLNNPFQPANNIVQQFELTKPRVVITSSEFLATISEVLKQNQSVEAVYLIDKKVCGYRCFHSELMNDRGDCSSYGKVNINTHEDICALPFSSGTTGLPKGVMLTHRNLVTNLLQLNAMRDVGAGNEVLLVQLPIFHIYGLVGSAARGLQLGCKLVTSPRFDSDQFLPLIERHKITRLHLVPPQVLFLLNHKEFDSYNLSSLRDISVGAAPMDEDSQIALLEKFSGNNPHLNIYQAYGLTETLVISITPRSSDRMPGKIKSVGQLVPNSALKIIDSQGKELKSGEVGEIVFQSPCLMKGYLNNHKATKDCIQDGWMLTGDLGYYDEDGYLYIEDRLKELIKYKGFQVPPAELEGILVSHPDIVQACVVGKPDPFAGELPFAFVKQTGNLSETDVKEFISERVAQYKKLRGGVTFVDDIPCSPSGKILRKELRKLIQ